MLFRAQRLFAGLRGIDPVRVDELIAVVMLVQIELHVWLGSSLQARVQTALAGVAASVAVAVRRRWPLAAVLAILALMAVQMALGGPRLGQEDPAAAIPALLLVFYGLGAYAPERRSTWALGLALVVISINQVTKSSAAPLSNLLPTDIFGVLLPWAIGRRVRERGSRGSCTT